ncbi:MAG: HlyD family efflux transporter periplasmic adaptor subunit [Planctomycetes bacterium]|nr:HlyD family efflux transporter periplasmic adaptor subunit [Planctomycetota bacterium]
MLRKLILPLMAIGLLSLAVIHMVRAQQSPPKPPPPVEPARPPFAASLAGSGLAEPQTENISIGSHLPGVVQEVLVAVGQKVDRGAPLFRLDDRKLQADLKARQSDLASAEAQLARLNNMPRPEELPSAEARIREARANLGAAQDKFLRTQTLHSQTVVSEAELISDRQALEMAREQLARAEADYRLLKAGAWEPDKLVARAAVDQARTHVEQVQVELERLVIGAPIDGEVLQVNVRPGEFVGAPPGQALIVLGSVHQLHVRVDIDEHDIPRFHAGAAAAAMPRGNAAAQYPLTFVRVEPYVVPKRSLTGDTVERVDTRVLQVIYALPPETPGLYVGQQLDVYVDACK